MLPPPRQGWPDHSRAGPIRGVDRRALTRLRLLNLLGGDYTNWLGLDDTDPDTYVGAKGRAVVVNSTETGLEFLGGAPALAGTVDDVVDDIDQLQTDLTAVQAAIALVEPSFFQAAPSLHGFTATNNYTYTHNRGVRPIVAVLDSNDAEIEVCARHYDENTVVVTFHGTLSNATLLLN